MFKGKFSLGKLLFKNIINKDEPLIFKAKESITYKIPNTIENLGLELLINGIYEDEIVNFFKKNTKDGDTFFDVGANIGSIGLPIIKKLVNVRYFAFEASPLTFEYLQYNLNANQIKNYETYNNLIHEDDDIQMKFYQSRKYGKSSLAPSYSDAFVYVNSISLDNFCNDKNISKIDIMKVDVQGFELYVFKGLKKTLLDRKVKNILFEFEDWAEKDAGLPVGSAQDYLLSMGYKLYDMNGSRLDNPLIKGSSMIWAKPV